MGGMLIVIALTVLAEARDFLLSLLSLWSAFDPLDLEILRPRLLRKRLWLIFSSGFRASTPEVEAKRQGNLLQAAVRAWPTLARWISTRSTTWLCRAMTCRPASH